MMTPLLVAVPVAVVEAAETTVQQQQQQFIVKEKDSHDVNDTTNTRSSSSATNLLFPMVGVGVGNLRRHLVDGIVTSSLDMGFQLVDTARASQNEHVIAKSIYNYRDRDRDHDDVQLQNDSDKNVHVITKVWYTHLGYNRTKLSVQESIQEMTSALQNKDVHHQDGDVSKRTKIRLHILLHWPRCNDRIEWMKCQEEEDALPQYIKDAGPPPHLDKEHAWKGSWRALEDLYLENQQPNQQQSGQVTIESIGVSNFELQDMKDLVKDCRVKPSLYQGNVWIVLHNPNLYHLLQENGIVFQAYNVMNGVLQRKNVAPNAFSVLSRIGNRLDTVVRRVESAGTREGEQPQGPIIAITESMVVMAWLVQEGISVIPRTSSLKHLLENSPSSIASVPTLTREEKEQVRAAMSALMRGEDIKIEATFQNKMSVPVKVYWRNGQTGQEYAVTQTLETGGAMSTIQTHPGHVFVVYEENQTTTTTSSIRKKFMVTASYGERQHFTILDDDDEL